MDRPSRIPGPPLPARRQAFRSRLSGVRRPWRVAVLVSVGLHLLLAAGLLWPVRKVPIDASSNPVGSVELLMVEQRGSGKAVPPTRPATAPPAASPPAAAVPPTPVVAPPDKAAAAVPALPSESDPAGEPVPPASREPPAPSKVADTPTPKTAPPPPQVVNVSKPEAAPAAKAEVPVFNLEGTDSDSNAIAFGTNVIPASPDDRFRNRPPVFPYDAAVRGEHGTVVLLIHVSELGVSTGADVAVTSGVTSLDHAALDAVRKWHFRPALKDGRSVAYDMPMRFIFDYE
jgi:protein TonB